MPHPISVCPTCKRNWDKTLHNWSEVWAGLGVLLMMIPLYLFLYPMGATMVLISALGLVVLFVSCIIHLYSEMRTRRYRSGGD